MELDGIPAFATGDLFSPHPTGKKDLWRICGRKDDQIMHSNGEKTNPGPMGNIKCSPSPELYWPFFCTRNNHLQTSGCLESTDVWERTIQHWRHHWASTIGVPRFQGRSITQSIYWRNMASANILVYSIKNWFWSGQMWKRPTLELLRTLVYLERYDSSRS